MDLTKVKLQNMTEGDLVDLAMFLEIPQSNTLVTAFDGGLMNLQQLIDTGNTTIVKFCNFMLQNIDPYPILVQKVMFRLNILRQLEGDTSRMENGTMLGMTGLHYAAKEECNDHLRLLRSLIPFRVDESFMSHHISQPRFIGK